jgi:hypothetical protein
MLRLNISITYLLLESGSMGYAALSVIIILEILLLIPGSTELKLLMIMLIAMAGLGIVVTSFRR